MPRPSDRYAKVGRRRALIFAAIILALCAGALVASSWVQSWIAPDRRALRAALEDPGLAYMQPAYAARGYRPIWLSGTSAPAAEGFIARLEAGREDGLSPQAYRPQQLRRQVANLASASPAQRVRTELLLSATYTAFIRDLHTPAATADVLYTDPDLQPRFRQPRQIMAHLAQAPKVRAAFSQSLRMNRFYRDMRAALARHRSTPQADRLVERTLLVNLDRLRALPADLGERFVFVDVAANRLWLYQGGNTVDTMKVIVGSQAQQTPQMAALIRYSIFNPFWNVPPDITRDTYAPQIAANPARLEELDMDPWSNFTARSVKLDPKDVDWNSVADGRSVGWLRQRPGPENAMGAVKFMLPNRYGIYLHDTPGRALFEQDERFFSAGCVRVEDARRLARWLYHGQERSARGGSPEQRVDLPAPVPVYIVYLTAVPGRAKVETRPDAYARDGAVIAALQSAHGPFKYGSGERVVSGA